MKVKIWSYSLFFIMVFIICTTEGTAQENQFQAGLKLGVVGSQIDGDGYTGWDKAGLTVGGFVRTDFTDHWGAQFDLLYSQKGSRDPQDAEKNKFNYYLIRLDYIEIPIDVQYTYNQFRAEAGLSFGVLVNSYEENEQGEVPLSPFDFRPFEFGYNLGGYFDVTEHIFLNVRYNRSFLPVSNEFRFLPAQFGFFGGSYNSSFSFALGYMF